MHARHRWQGTAGKTPLARHRWQEVWHTILWHKTSRTEKGAQPLENQTG